MANPQGAVPDREVVRDHPPQSSVPLKFTLFPFQGGGQYLFAWDIATSLTDRNNLGNAGGGQLGTFPAVGWYAVGPILDVYVWPISNSPVIVYIYEAVHGVIDGAGTSTYRIVKTLIAPIGAPTRRTHRIGGTAVQVRMLALIAGDGNGTPTEICCTVRPC